jgi:hypothetical protein
MRKDVCRWSLEEICICKYLSMCSLVLRCTVDRYPLHFSRISEGKASDFRDYDGLQNLTNIIKVWERSWALCKTSPLTLTQQLSTSPNLPLDETNLIALKKLFWICNHGDDILTCEDINFSKSRNIGISLIIIY